MECACEFMWKYCIIITNVMQPESNFSSLITHNYSVFQSKLIFESERSKDSCCFNKAPLLNSAIR